MHIIQEEIGQPKLTMVSSGGNSAVFTISPLPSGFGHTLGNAIRRVLLSSLPGAAITAVRVNGATHEYSTLAGMKDSVLEMILNLKQIRVKKHSSGAEVATLQKKGEGPVYAKDIKTSSDIEILNPDQLITMLDSKSASLSLELKFDKGVGYLPVKNREKDEPEAGWILMDATFSSVLAVRYEVLPTRVGARTNLDKLEIEVTTNGSLKPEEAVKFASEVLKNYFDIFGTVSEEAVEPDFITDFSKMALEEAKTEEKNVNESYTPIEILNLSPRTLNALINGGKGSVEEVVQCSLAQLSTLRGFGKKAQDELIKALSERGLALKE